MKKCFVCIVESEAMLNYLFLRECLAVGDEALLIAPRKFQNRAKVLGNLFATKHKVNFITLHSDGDEIIWDTMCRTIRAELSREYQYHVNLSGGSRIMCIAVQQVFEGFNSLFYFVPHDRNMIVHSQIDDNNDNNDDVFTPISRRVSVKEYLMVNDLTYKSKRITQEEVYSNHLFELFSNNYLSTKEYNTIECLRSFRNKYIDLSFKSKFEKIDDLISLLDFLSFAPKEPNRLSFEEVQYLTGGWFEEWVYHKIKEVVKPDDIALGVEIRKANGSTCNDIDIAFTLNNQLHAIECKTGVGRMGLFNQIVYKACALNEALLGMRSFTYIFSLNTDHDDVMHRMARSMRITYCDKKTITNDERLLQIILKSQFV